MPNDLSFDIETGGLPWEQIESLYVPPPTLPPWNESMVKYGQMKDAVKRAEKHDQVEAAYRIQLADESRAAEAHRVDWINSAALSPVTGQVLAIGFKRGETLAIIGDGGETEPEILTAFWAVYKKHHASSRFIGFCSNFFDFPFIVWRSYFHGIAVPENAWDKTGKYPAYCFVDLIDRLPKRGFSDESRKLTDICSWLGLGSKPDGVDGSMFATLWAGNEDSKQQAIAYLQNDLELTWKLGERMGVIL